MRRLVRICAAGAALAALAALVAPVAALGQGGQLKLSESPTTGFPDKAYLLQLPKKQALTAGNVSVTENGGPVVGLAVEPPGGSASGAMLLIDASNSMKGAPIAGAATAARAFLAERKEDLPLAIIAFNPNVNVLSEFTTDREDLAAAVAETPSTAEGTHIYDALIKASEMAGDEDQARTTIVLLSDGANYDTSESSLAEALSALEEANVRVISIGLKSDQYTPQTLQTLAARTGGSYIEALTPASLAQIYSEVSAKLSNEYEVTYRSVLPPEREAVVAATVAGYAPATATYTTPELDLAPRGTFEQSWTDQVIVSPYLMVFVVIAVLALIGFAVMTVLEARKRSLKRRMAMYVTVPSEEESRERRAEVSAMLAQQAQQRIGGLRSWQRFENDVEIGAFTLTPLAILFWTIVAGIVASLVAAVALQSLWGLLIGLLAPFVMRWYVTRKVRKVREAFDEQLPDNLDVLAGAMRTGHSVMGALAVMVESADEPSKTEFRRVLQDEQLGVPLDDALMVMARRMESYDAEQVAMVMRLQREAGGNTAEVLDRVAETIRGRMELRRLVQVLTAQARISRWILTSLPIFLLVALTFTGGDYLDPLTSTLIGKISLVVGAVMVLIGSFWIKKIAEMDV
ncbi:MAG: VWA domain-containing protein [Gaiellaceae bacterium]